MGALGALLGRILVAVLGNTALTNQIMAALGIPAQQDTLLGVATDAAISRSVLDWSDVSPGPLKTALIAIEADMATMSAAVLAAVADAQQAVNPVILPTIPPSGYGGGDPNAIWDFEVGPDGLLAQDLLYSAGHLAQSTIASAGLIVGSSDYFRLSGSDIALIPAVPLDDEAPKVSAATILADDTRLTWLNREWDITGSWLLDTETDLYYYSPGGGGTDYRWVCMIDAEWFSRLKAAALDIPTSLVLPPLWPGLDAVALGTPVALDTGLTITEIMDGVIVTITSQPSRLVFFSFDDANSYRNLGALSFFSDNGDQEPFQPLGFTSAIYCAKTMKRAAGVKLRTSGGVTGTITPWTIVAG